VASLVVRRLHLTPPWGRTNWPSHQVHPAATHFPRFPDAQPCLPGLPMDSWPAELGLPGPLGRVKKPGLRRPV